MKVSWEEEDASFFECIAGNIFFDEYDCDNEQVPPYWVNSLESIVDAADGDGFHCIDSDQTDYYVSVDGNDDANTGTETSPFLTIEKVFSSEKKEAFSK